MNFVFEANVSANIPNQSQKQNIAQLTFAFCCPYFRLNKKFMLKFINTPTIIYL